MNLRAFLLMIGALFCNCMHCLCHSPYHYHRVPYAENVYQQNLPLHVLAAYPVHLGPMYAPDGQIFEANGAAQAAAPVPSCPNDLRQSRVFTKLFSLPGAVVDSLLSGQITV